MRRRILSAKSIQALRAEKGFTPTNRDGDSAGTHARRSGESRFGYWSLMRSQQCVDARGVGELCGQRWVVNNQPLTGQLTGRNT